MNAIGQAVPELPVADVEAAQRHYCDVLGFTFGWLTPDKAMGAVSRGGAVIFFRAAPEPRTPAVHWIFAEDVDAVYAELAASGAYIVDPIEDKPWNIRQFTIEDPDGHRFHFHHDIAP